MTTHDPGLRRAIAANPQDAGLYEILADWLETTDAGRCDPLWSVRVNRHLLPYAQTPPYRMRLTAKCLRLMDERSHGFFDAAGLPTFKLLPDHVSQFVAYLQEMEDKRAEMAAMRVLVHEEAHFRGYKIEYPAANPGPSGFVFSGAAAYADACREWVRRLLDIVTKRCPLRVEGEARRRSASGMITPAYRCYAKTRMPGTRRRNCKVCLNLGWVVTYPEE